MPCSTIVLYSIHFIIVLKSLAPLSNCRVPQTSSCSGAAIGCRLCGLASLPASDRGIRSLWWSQSLLGLRLAPGFIFAFDCSMDCFGGSIDCRRRFHRILRIGTWRASRTPFGRPLTRSQSHPRGFYLKICGWSWRPRTPCYMSCLCWRTSSHAWSRQAGAWSWRWNFSPTSSLSGACLGLFADFVKPPGCWCGGFRYTVDRCHFLL